MERNLGEHICCKLQIYASAGWLDMLYFEPAQRERITAAMAAICQETASSVTWRVIHDGVNPRDWPTTPELWQPVTDQEPVPLEDVLISVSTENDEEPIVFMAYRKALGTKTFYISGTSDQAIEGAYAWKHIDQPAPVPN